MNPLMFVLRVQESIFFSWSELNSPKNMSCNSNAILQIVAVGAQDKYLTKFKHHVLAHASHAVHQLCS